MAGQQIELRCRTGAQHCIAGVRVNGKLLSKARVKTGTPDCERVATMIAIEKLLEIATSDRADRILPRPVSAALSVALQIVKLRHRAMMGEKGGEERFKAALAAAKKSPIRSLRAIAAGVEEFIK